MGNIFLDNSLWFKGALVLKNECTEDVCYTLVIHIKKKKVQLGTLLLPFFKNKLDFLFYS